MPTPDHHVAATDPTDATVHHDWDADRDPVLTVDPGDVVRFECLDATGGELAPGATVEDVRERESPGHAMTGPVAVAGSRLELPVEVPGGLFSIGDGHAAQGDGEVCVTAIECPITVDVRFELLEAPPSAPRFETPGGRPRREGPAIGTTGIGPDVETAAREALSAMIDRLEGRGFDRVRAYLLCSVAADLQLSQVVNDPNRTVACRLPTSVLGE